MLSNSQFKRTLRTDIKRAVRSLPGFFATAVIFVAIAGIITYYAKYFVFDKEMFSSVKVAYYVDTNDELGQGQIDIISDMESIQESASLIPVESEEAGKEMLLNKEVSALLVVPGNFVSDMGSEDSAIRVYFNEDESFEGYLVNDIVTIISKLYGDARTAVLSYRTIARDSGYDEEIVKKGYNSLNTKLFTDVFARTGGYEIKDIDSAGSFSLEQQFTCSMIVLVMFLMSFWLTAFYKGHNTSYKMLQRMSGVNSLKLSLSSILCGTGMLYILYLLIFALLKMFKREVMVSSLVTVIPVLVLVAGIVFLLSCYIASEHVVNIVIFLGVVILIYLAGGFIPLLLMPEFMRSVAAVNPMTYLLKVLSHILY